MAERADSHDQKSAHKFFQFLFSIFVAGYIELRSIRPSGGALKPEFFPVTNPVAAAERAIELREKADVYFGVAPRTEESGKAAVVVEIPALWADIDTDEARAGLARFPLTPSIVVRSGSGENVHVYWVLDRPIDAEEAERLMRALAMQIDSDRRVTDRTRILRVPGTLNHKGGQAAPVTLERCSDLRYSVAELRRALDADTGGLQDKPPLLDPLSIEIEVSSEPVARVLRLLSEVHGGTGKWTALCPAHDDTRPSLSIAEGDDGRCLLKCHAGCETEEIVSHLRLGMTDLFVGGPAKRAAGRLLELAENDGLEVFHMGELPFASMTVDGHLRTWPIGSSAFALQLRRIQYANSQEGLGLAVLEEAVATLKARAIFDGEEKPVHRRIAWIDDRILIDIGESELVAEVTASGWKVVTNPDIHFLREKDDLAFAIPIAGGTIDELRRFTNCSSEGDFQVFVGGITAVLQPNGPYPVLYITGEQGSAKTTHSFLVASLADPRKAPLLMGSPGRKDLAVIGSGVRLLGLDNVSHISPAHSDLLCQLSTGAGHRDRTLYTDAEQTVLEMKLAIQLNGIGNVITRPDLQDRTWVVELDAIEARLYEEEFWAAWDEARPRIFGAILDGLASALANYRSIELGTVPRMADAARWVEAAALAFDWEPGSIIDATQGGQAELAESAIEGQPVLQELIELVVEKREWKESSTKLLQTLAARLETTGNALPANWPKRGDQLTKLLKRFESDLRGRGVEFVVERTGGGNRSRQLRFWTRDAGTRRDA